MKVIKREGFYRLVYDDSQLNQWRVEYHANGFWQQASKAYFYRGWAGRFFDRVKNKTYYVSNLRS